MENGRKVPYYANGVKRHGEQGGNADRASLTTSDQALAALRDGEGLGLAMLPEWSLVCVDLDHCIASDGSLSPDAQALVAAAGETYIEVSPSGKGLHIWLRGSFRDEKNKAAGVESFCAQHYLTMTGNVYAGAASQIATMTSSFAAALDARLRVRAQPTSPSLARVRNVEQLLDDLRSALPYVDAYVRETWLEACWAVGRDTGQSQEGFDLLLPWAAASPAHNPNTDPRHMRREYFEKSREERQNPVTTRTLFKKAREAGWRPERERIFNPDQARIRLDEVLPEPEFIVPGYLPFGTVGGLPAEGGAGKTTFTLWEAAHIALGRRLFNKEMKKPGAVLFITAEDDRAILAFRLQQVAAALGLSDEDRAKLERRIFIEDLTGKMVRLVQADERGNLTATYVGDVLIEAYRDRGLVLINIDPTNLFGPGERYVNDAEAALMVEGARIARELKCTVRYVHHIGKANARDGVVDQYASRGGSAFADNSRFQHLLVRHDLEAARKYPVPPLSSSAETEEAKRAAEDGRLLRLHVTKLSWAARPLEPQWLIREGLGGFKVLHVPEMSRAERREIAQGEVEKRVVEYVRTQLAAGVKLSPTALIGLHVAYELSRDRARAVVAHLMRQGGELILRQLPEAERHGRLQEYLEPAPEGVF
jgi:hypothetical protein